MEKRRSAIIRSFGRFIYSVSDVIIFVSNSLANIDLLKSIFEISKQVELANPPILILVLNKSYCMMNEEELKNSWEAVLNKTFDLSEFLSVKYLSIPMCTINGNLFESQIMKLKVLLPFLEIINFFRN